jgi:putative transcriptional regulator
MVTAVLMEEIQIRLREIRKERGLSQNELARKIEQSVTNVQNIEYGNIKSVTIDTLKALCKALDCQPGDLLIYVPDLDDEA